MRVAYGERAAKCYFKRICNMASGIPGTYEIIGRSVYNDAALMISPITSVAFSDAYTAIMTWNFCAAFLD